jgi:hypothetical protein
VAKVVSVGEVHGKAVPGLEVEAARVLDLEFGLELERLDSKETTLANSI